MSYPYKTTGKMIKMIVFWDVAQCSLVETDPRFRGAYCVHHQRDPKRQSSSNSSPWEPEISLSKPLWGGYCTVRSEGDSKPFESRKPVTFFPALPSAMQRPGHGPPFHLRNFPEDSHLHTRRRQNWNLIIFIFLDMKEGEFVTKKRNLRVKSWDQMWLAISNIVTNSRSFP
jgi:hypothetical protein